MRGMVFKHLANDHPARFGGGRDDCVCDCAGVMESRRAPSSWPILAASLGICGHARNRKCGGQGAITGSVRLASGQKASASQIGQTAASNEAHKQVSPKVSSPEAPDTKLSQMPEDCRRCPSRPLLPLAGATPGDSLEADPGQERENHDDLCATNR